MTQAQWKAVMGNNPSLFKGRDRPVENINDWQDTQELSRNSTRFATDIVIGCPLKRNGNTLRAPEAQGSTPGCAGCHRVVHRNIRLHHAPCRAKTTEHMGTLRCPWKRVGMGAGLVQSVDYDNSPTFDPQGPPEGSQHTFRGGSWTASAYEIRASYRGNLRSERNGLRLWFSPGARSRAE